jgi:hypothetical protein
MDRSRTLRCAATTIAIALVTLLAAATSSSAALIGLSSGSPGTLYSINSGTGAATNLTNITGSTSLVGIEYMNGTLYATDVNPGGGGFTFGTIDIMTGAYTVINNQAGSANWHGLAGNPASGLLYTIDINNSNILTAIDPLANVVTPIGSGNSGVDGRGMAYDAVHGILYASGGSNLFTVNTTTGVATLVGSMGIGPGYFGLAYDPLADVLYGNSGDSRSLYRIDANTGNATLIGANGVGAQIDGLADVPETSTVPEPISLVLVGTGLGVTRLAARRRRK